LPTTSSQPVYPRPFQLSLFLTGVLWTIAAGSLAAHAAQGIVTRLNLPAFDELLQQAFFLFLLVWGFAALHWIATRASAGVGFINGLPARPTAPQEWQLGAALGWGMLLVALVPMMLTGTLHPQFMLELPNWGLAVLSILTLALSTLAIEVTFRGFIFARLIDTIGPVTATIILSLAYAILSGYRPNATGLSVFITFFLGVLYSMAYLRTRALWLGWGLHFAWSAAMAIFFGLPVAGYANYNNLVFTSVSGSDRITGGAYGPEAAFLTLFVVLGAMIVLHRITRNYAWEYTHTPIVSAGYPMDIAPPAAHTAMEATANAAPAPLVQILSTTPTASSTMPVIDEHLRRDPATPPDE
jgi:membrane protease YdiL (CAAX protease family)